MPLDEAVDTLLPLVQQIMVRVLPDDSPQALMIQRLALKTFYALIQYQLPLGERGSCTRFQQWMELVKHVLAR